MPSEISSPIRQEWNSRLIRSIPVSKVLQLYSDGFGIDVAKFFPSGLAEIQIRECTHTGYQFYYPPNIDGDGEFYGALEEYSWYYEPWKWEYDQAIKCMTPKHQVLEIGSGGNIFLAKLKSLGFEQITGLELNPNSVEKAIRQGLRVLPDTIQKHAENNLEKYDVVTSFQVLEHISDVQSFLKSAVAVLKRSGTLILSVPNNNSYLGLDMECTLNLPPHHMGLWNRSSLCNIAEQFGLTVKETHFEPMTAFRRPYFYGVIHKGKTPRIFYKIARRLIPRFFECRYSEEFLAYTIQVQYIKK